MQKPSSSESSPFSLFSRRSTTSGLFMPNRIRAPEPEVIFSEELLWNAGMLQAVKSTPHEDDDNMGLRDVDDSFTYETYESWQHKNARKINAMATLFLIRNPDMMEEVVALAVEKLQGVQPRISFNKAIEMGRAVMVGERVNEEDETEWEEEDSKDGEVKYLPWTREQLFDELREWKKRKVIREAEDQDEVNGDQDEVSGDQDEVSGDQDEVNGDQYEVNGKRRRLRGPSQSRQSCLGLDDKTLMPPPARPNRISTNGAHRSEPSKNGRAMEPPSNGNGENHSGPPTKTSRGARTPEPQHSRSGRTIENGGAMESPSNGNGENHSGPPTETPKRARTPEPQYSRCGRAIKVPKRLDDVICGRQSPK